MEAFKTRHLLENQEKKLSYKNKALQSLIEKQVQKKTDNDENEDNINYEIDYLSLQRHKYHTYIHIHIT